MLIENYDFSWKKAKVWNINRKQNFASRNQLQIYIHMKFVFIEIPDVQPPETEGKK